MNKLNFYPENMINDSDFSKPSTYYLQIPYSLLFISIFYK